jgi:hypothetical protein
MKRNEYSFDKTDFNRSRAVIPTERKRLTKVSLFFFLQIPYTLFIYMETATITLTILF